MKILVSKFCPLQLFPPKAGLGLVHVLVRVLTPPWSPQVSVGLDHSLHADHPPSNAVEVLVRTNIFKITKARYKNKDERYKNKDERYKNKDERYKR